MFGSIALAGRLRIRIARLLDLASKSAYDLFRAQGASGPRKGQCPPEKPTHIY